MSWFFVNITHETKNIKYLFFVGLFELSAFTWGNLLWRNIFLQMRYPSMKMSSNDRVIRIIKFTILFVIVYSFAIKSKAFVRFLPIQFFKNQNQRIQLLLRDFLYQFNVFTVYVSIQVFVCDTCFIIMHKWKDKLYEHLMMRKKASFLTNFLGNQVKVLFIHSTLSQILLGHN